MANKLDDISVNIGGLLAGQEALRVSVKEMLARQEALDSSVQARLYKIDNDVTNLKLANVKHSTILGGGTAIIVLGLKGFIDKWI
jgi:hypothetical protein